MRVGFATIDITPAIGSEIPGGFTPRVATGVLDPLQASACVVEGDRGPRLAVVGVDAVSVPEAVVTAVRQRAAAGAGLAARDLLVAASHTHCGGPSHDVLGTAADPGYTALLVERLSAAVMQAAATMVPAELVEAGTECPGWAFNRRWLMRDGSHRTLPGKDNPDKIRPAGPIDPEVRLLGFRSATGAWLGAIANFACHSTVVSGCAFSADYAGAWRRALARRVGNAGFTLVFLNGACGDLTQIDFANPAVKESGPAWAERMGEALAGRAWDALQAGQATGVVASRSAHGEVTVGYRVPTPEQLAADRDRMTTDQPWTAATWQARDRVLLAERLAGKTSGVVPVDAYRLGGTAIAAAPWQPFCEYGLALRRAAGLPLLIATFANGTCGYVPTPAAFVGGGYEPTLGRGSYLDPAAGDLLVSGLLTQLRTLRD